MAGPMVNINYVSEDGVTYAISVPSWQQALTGDATATSTTTMPKGYQRRHRMIRDDTSGREHKVTVGDRALSAWTAAFGATVTGLTAIPGVSATTFKYAGRIGERDLIRGRKVF